jgi:hypothetical protein
MENFNRGCVQLYFKFGAVHNAYMSAHIVDATGTRPITKDKNDHAMVETMVDFPGELLILLDGKNNNTDTLIDDSGNIIQDKFIQLTQVKVDRMAVSDHFLQKWPLVNDSFVSTYFGFNGQVRLQFNEPNSFYWLLKTRQ